MLQFYRFCLRAQWNTRRIKFSQSHSPEKGQASLPLQGSSQNSIFICYSFIEFYIFWQIYRLHLRAQWNTRRIQFSQSHSPEKGQASLLLQGSSQNSIFICYSFIEFYIFLQSYRLHLRAQWNTRRKILTESQPWKGPSLSAASGIKPQHYILM